VSEAYRSRLLSPAPLSAPLPKFGPGAAAGRRGATELP